MKGNAERNEIKQKVSRRSGYRTPALYSAEPGQMMEMIALHTLSPIEKDAVMQISKLIEDHLSSFPCYYFFLNWNVTLVL